MLGLRRLRGGPTRTAHMHQELAFAEGTSLFVVKGSAILSKPVLLKSILAGCSGTGAYFYHSIRPDRGLATIQPFYFTVIGTCLSFLLVFKSNMAYSRWWEARGHVGTVCSNMRSFMRKLVFSSRLQHVDKPSQRCVARCQRYLRAFFLLLTQDLQLTQDLSAIPDEVLSLKEKDALLPTRRRALLVLAWLQLTIADLVREGVMTERMQMNLETHLEHLSLGYHGCTKIKSSPLPFSYAQLIALLTTIYCFAAPICFIESFGVYIGIPTFIMALTFFGINRVGTELSDPFGTDANDVNLQAFQKQLEEDIANYAFQWTLQPAYATSGLPAKLTASDEAELAAADSRTPSGQTNSIPRRAPASLLAGVAKAAQG